MCNNLANEGALNCWFNKFCKKADGIKDVGSAAQMAAKLSYRASITRALYDSNGNMIGFSDKKAESKLCRSEGEKQIAELLEKLCSTAPDQQRDIIINAWKSIRKIYHDKGIEWYTFGNAQKWVNMAVKYLIVILIHNKIEQYGEQIIDAALFPVDGIMIQRIKQEFGIDFKGKSWSKCDCKETFKNYIDETEEAVKAKNRTTLFDYELNAWKQ